MVRRLLRSNPVSLMKILAVLLIVVGIAAFAYGGFSFKSRETVIDAGPIEVTREETKRVPLPPIVGGLAVAAGVGMLIVGRKH